MLSVCKEPGATKNGGGAAAEMPAGRVDFPGAVPADPLAQAMGRLVASTNLESCEDLVIVNKTRHRCGKGAIGALPYKDVSTAAVSRFLEACRFILRLGVHWSFFSGMGCLK